MEARQDHRLARSRGGFTDRRVYERVAERHQQCQRRRAPGGELKGLSAQDGLIGLYNQYLNDSTIIYDDLTQATRGLQWQRPGGPRQAPAAFASDYQKLNNAGQGLALAINSVAGMAVTSDSGFPNWDAYASSASPSPALPQLPNT